MTIIKQLETENKKLHKKLKDAENVLKQGDSKSKVVKRSNKNRQLYNRNNVQITSILESITDSFISLDPKWNYLYVNKQAARVINNKSPKELIGRNIWKDHPELTGTLFYKECQRAIDTKKLVQFESHFTPLDRWFIVQAYPTSEGLSLYFSDITKQKKAEEKLRQNELLYRTVVEHTTDLIALIDSEANFLYVSPSHKVTLGYTQDELVGKNGFLLVHPADIKKTQTGLKRVIQGQVSKETYRVQHKNGTWIYIETRGSTIVDDEGKPLMVVLTSHDVTERTELEIRKDEFITMASHELKTPVTTMKLYSEILARHVKLNTDEKAVEFVEKINDQTNKLKELVSNLLDISRIQTGKLLLNKEPFDIAELIQDTLDGLQGTARRHKLILKQKKQAIITGDRYRLYQVLTNLITNGIKYSPKGEKIEINVKNDGKQAVISVQDFGIGIPADQQKKIFDKLYQVPDMKERTYPGLGMGLFISLEIIRKHGGEMWVQSTEGKGATFSFSLPLFKASST